MSVGHSLTQLSAFLVAAAVVVVVVVVVPI